MYIYIYIYIYLDTGSDNVRHPVASIQTPLCTYARPGPGPTGTHRPSTTNKAVSIYKNLLGLYTYRFMPRPVQVKGPHPRPPVSRQRALAFPD